MKGYFSSLAKQSGVLIGAGKSSARTRAGQSTQAPLTQPVAPLHSESVHFVDSAPTNLTLAPDTQPIEKAGHHPSEHSPAPNEDPNVPGQSGSASSSFATLAVSNSPREARANEAVRLVPEPVETPFSNSATPFALERSEDDTLPAIDRTDVAVEGHSPKKGGVIRVGESDTSVEMETAREADLFSEVFRDTAPRVSSIPHDYLEGIRDWLNSAPIDSIKSESRRTSKESSETFATAKEADHSRHSRFAEPALPPQNEIQEFSLSIGSISIVVEDPSPPKQQTSNVQPHATAPVRSAPRTHDAFALNRRYFRGF